MTVAEIRAWFEGIDKNNMEQVFRDDWVPRMETLLKAHEDTVDLLEEAKQHLEYCGYGDSWERECADDLPQRLDAFFQEVRPPEPDNSKEHWARCKTCGKTFTKHADYIQHRKDSHTFVCTTCNRIFTTEIGLRAHIRCKHQ